MGLNKHKLKVYILKNIQQHAPDSLNMIEKRSWNEVWLYVQGYMDGMDDFSTPPNNKKEMEILLKEVGGKFFFKKLLPH